MQPVDLPSQCSAAQANSRPAMFHAELTTACCARRVPEECPQEVADLIAACMSSSPEQRPTAEQIIAALSPLLAAGALRQTSPSGQTPPAVVAAQHVGSAEQGSPLAQHAGQLTGGSAAGHLPTGPSDRLSTPAVTDAPAQQPSPEAAASQAVAASQPQQPQQQPGQSVAATTQQSLVPLSKKSVTI